VGKHGKRGYPDPVIGQELLGQRLPPCQDEPARVAAGVGDPKQFEVAGDVLVVGGLPVKLLEQVEDHVGVHRFDGIADRSKFVLHAKGLDSVAGGPEGGDDVKLGLPAVDLLLAVSLQGVGRDELRVHQHEDPKRFHSAIQSRREGLYRECIVFTVRSTVKSMRSCRAGPTARSLSWRQRPIMSPRTASRVS